MLTQQVYLRCKHHFNLVINTTCITSHLKLILLSTNAQLIFCGNYNIYYLIRIKSNAMRAY